jgi:penicillin-binding protein 2
MRDKKQKQHTFSRRTFVLGGIKLFLLSAIGLRYYYLQIVQSSQFSTLSDKNRLKMLLVPPPRALVLDRNEKILVENKAEFSVGVESAYLKDLDYIIMKIEEILSVSLELTHEELRKRIARRQPHDYFFLKNRLDWKEVARILEHEHMLPGVEVVEILNRHYVYASACAHVLGYVSAANKQEVEDGGLSYSNQVKIGKIGVEKLFDEQLRGQSGFKKTEVDARGKLVRTLENGAVIKGSDLKLAIDVDLQVFLHDLFAQHGLVASAIVMEAQTGKIMALHSSPSFDPNLFVGGISKDEWQKLMHAADNPLLNHAISSAYPPGSNFKLVTALAALAEGLDPKTKYFCSGEFSIGSRVFKCWNHAGHGSIDMHTAIPQSCNPYFFSVALKVGINKIHSMSKLLGLGEITGIELLGEVKGLIPSPEWKKKRFRLDWYPGDTLNACIGQGFTLLTPIQIATMTARIASGKAVTPTLVYESASSVQDLDVDPVALQIVRKGMYDCVNAPYGVLYNRRLSTDRMIICGKTGTAQVAALKYKNKGHHLKHHGLFTSFAPYLNPKYVVTVVVEHGEAGSKVAPYAAEIYRKCEALGY